MESGKAGGPFETPWGYHLIWIIENSPSRTLSYEEVKEEAMRIKKVLLFEEYLNELWYYAEVQVLI